MMHDYRTEIRNAVEDEKTFLRLTLSKRLREEDTPWVKVAVRPVALKGKRRLQFSYFDGKKDITKNYSGDEIADRLSEALDMPFGSIHLQTTAGDVHVRTTRKGRVLVTRGKASRKEQQPVLSHDHTKRQPLNPGVPDPFLQAIGVTNEKGKVRPSMQAKFRQINQFLRVVEQVVPSKGPITVLDCGCGSAYLTFAAYHYLHDLRGLPVRVTGIDVNEELIRKTNLFRDSLGWSDLSFEVSAIREYVPKEPPDLVLSLHACDTATDEAIAQGILWGSRAILAAPCCQHELNDQIQAPVFRPVLRHGILKERLADILTDALRALALRIMGYRTSVIEFVSPEHTAKNLMIRAETGAGPGDMEIVREYRDLKEFWHVSPSIETMLGDEFRKYLL